MKPTGKVNPATGEPYRYGDMSDFASQNLNLLREALAGYGNRALEGGREVAGAAGDVLGGEAQALGQSYADSLEKWGVLGTALKPFRDAYDATRQFGEFIGEQAAGMVEQAGRGDPITRALIGSGGMEWMGMGDQRGQGAAQAGEAGPLLPSGIPGYLASPEQQYSELSQQPPPQGAPPQGGPGGEQGHSPFPFAGYSGGGVSFSGGGGGAAVEGRERGLPSADDLYQLSPSQQALMGQYEQTAPSPMPRPEEGEQLMRVLAGLASGAANYQPGPGGVARAIAGAGAGGLEQGLGYEAEMRQAQYADQQAQREYQMNRIVLENEMRQHSAELELKRQAIMAEEANARLRAAAQQSRAWATANKVNASPTPTGTWFYNSFGRQFVPMPLTVGWIVDSVKNIQALGEGQGGLNAHIIDQVLNAEDVHPLLKEEYAIAAQLYANQLDPEFIQEVENSDAVADNSQYGMLTAAAIQKDPQAMAQRDNFLVHAIAMELLRRPDKKEEYKRMLGGYTPPSRTPFERGMGVFKQSGAPILGGE